MLLLIIIFSTHSNFVCPGVTYFAKLQAASARSDAAIKHGSFGIGKGGLDLKAVLFWAVVGIPLAWGVWKILESAIKIF